jgi:hypothetical protein
MYRAILCLEMGLSKNLRGVVREEAIHDVSKLAGMVTAKSSGKTRSLDAFDVAQMLSR